VTGHGTSWQRSHIEYAQLAADWCGASFKKACRGNHFVWMFSVILFMASGNYTQWNFVNASSKLKSRNNLTMLKFAN
jgi:hypothetical protein